MGHPVAASPYTEIPRPANKRIYKHGNSKQVEKAAEKQPVNELKMPRPANYVVASPSPRFQDRPTHLWNPHQFIENIDIRKMSQKMLKYAVMHAGGRFDDKIWSGGP